MTDLSICIKLCNSITSAPAVIPYALRIKAIVWTIFATLDMLVCAADTQQCICAIPMECIVQKAANKICLKILK
jgi:hypothetical protein